jgi:hypothetical protein
MRVLIDECVDPRAKRHFEGHDARTVPDEGWGSLEDRQLLQLAQGRFDVLVTIDRGLPFEQNLAKLRIGIIVVEVPKNQFAHYDHLRAELLEAVLQTVPGQVLRVPSR